MDNVKMTTVVLFLALLFSGCDSDDPKKEPEPEPEEVEFTFGADLSYVNQILDHGGVYKENNTTKDPYQIFKSKGTEVVRLRLWHNPTWTKDVYDNGTQLYNDLADVERAMQKAKDNDMKVLLDFHYSDEWADPSKQYIPAAWKGITSLNVLKDSIYNYTFKTLTRLKNKGLLPAYVQVGNETNCGMFISDVPSGFPACNVCNSNWANMGSVFNSAIDAVRDVSADTKVILHVADPKNVQWWFDNMTTAGGVTDFDIIGFSYYPIWHTTVGVSGLSDQVANFITRFDKEVWMLETAYPWTTAGDDSYNNAFGAGISGYPVTADGQLAIMKAMAQELIDGGGTGMIYWEPAWISSEMKDMWGTGSSWENATLFDFDGNSTIGFDYMTYPYTQ